MRQDPDLPTICEKGRHQNCVHTKAQARRGPEPKSAKPQRP